MYFQFAVENDEIYSWGANRDSALDTRAREQAEPSCDITISGTARGKPLGGLGLRKRMFEIPPTLGRLNPPAGFTL